MHASPTGFNPFILMMDPASVFEALERSDRLGRLAGRICRPLDKPLTGMAGAAEGAAEALDAEAAEDLEA